MVVQHSHWHIRAQRITCFVRCTLLNVCAGLVHVCPVSLASAAFSEELVSCLQCRHTLSLLLMPVGGSLFRSYLCLLLPYLHQLLVWPRACIHRAANDMQVLPVCQSFLLVSYFYQSSLSLSLSLSDMKQSLSFLTSCAPPRAALVSAMSLSRVSQ